MKSSADFTGLRFRSNDDYDHLTKFEEGEEGECSVVRSKTTGKLLVMKHTRPKRTQSAVAQQTGRRRPLPNEVKILQRLRPYTNIVQFLAAEPSPSNPSRHLIFLEYCSGGDLLDQLRKFQDLKFKPPPIFTLHVLISLVHAFAYLHHGRRYSAPGKFVQDWKHEPIIHGDIKPENIFLRWPSQTCGLPDVVLGDFGMAQLACESRGITGTPGYDPPEVREVALLKTCDPAAYQRRRNARIMTTKSDMYQLGLVVHLVATSKHFEFGKDPSKIQLPESYRGVTGLLSALVWCLQPEAAGRPDCTGMMDRGLLLAVNTFIRKRDAMFAKDGPLEKRVWNVSDLKEGPPAVATTMEQA